MVFATKISGYRYGFSFGTSMGAPILIVDPNRL
jgi:hypothetical protein